MHLLLVAATVLVKVIGALFFYPIANLVGSVSSGFFASAYNLFTLFMQFVGRFAGGGLFQNGCRNIGKTEDYIPGQQKDFHLALFTFLIVGFIAMVIIAVFAKPFVTMQKSAGALWSVSRCARNDECRRSANREFSEYVNAWKNLH